MSLEVTIKKKVGSFSLDISFRAAEEVFALLGASGCGKSMTLKCIAGIETPDEGRIVLNERVLFDSSKKINLPPQERGVGYMFQDYALFQNMTVEENIMAGMHEKRKQTCLKQVTEYLQAFHLDGLQGQYPRQLSGGQKQRLAMARMMASKPQVILLDEPFAALDSYLKRQMLSEMKQELASRSCPVLLVTHDRDEAFALGQTICAIKQGSVDCVQKKRDFFANPRTVNAAILSGCKNIARVRRIDEEHILAEEWNIILKTKPGNISFSHIGIRAHDLVPSNVSDGTFHCVSYRIEEALFEWNIYVTMEGAQKEFLWKIAKEHADLSEAPQVPSYFTVDEAHILFLQ